MKSLILSLSILIFTGWTNLQAQATGNWSNFTATDFDTGSGDGNTPHTSHLIATPEQLAYLAQQVSSGNNFGGKYFRLAGNIDLKEHAWSSIGNASNPFAGHFNGGGYRIENLFINDEMMDYAGLFGYISGGSIDSLAVVQSTINGGNFTGAITGKADNISITNSYAINMITGKSAVGGLIGYAENISASNNYTDGIITSLSKTGGLMGEIYNSVVSHCYSTSMITASGDMVGGLIGYASASQINNNAAANRIISGGNNINRIAGLKETGTSLGFNYAYSKMQLNQTSVQNDDPDDENGKDVEYLYFFTRLFYTEDNFSPAWDFNNIWKVEEEQRLPYFTGQSSPLELSDVHLDSINGYYNMAFQPDSIVIFCNYQRYKLTPADYNEGNWSLKLTPKLNVNDLVWITNYESGKSPSISEWRFVNPFSEGIGTETFPFGISTAKELDAIRAVVDKDYHFMLLDDIDLQEYVNWDPIGDTSMPFKGYLNGNGYVVRNLTIERIADNQGLFGVVTDSRLENMFLSDISIKGNNCIGGLVGQTINTSINNTFVIANIEAENTAGSIAGKLTENSTISHSISGGSISLTGNYGGGIAGQADNSEVKYCVVTNLSLTGISLLGRITGNTSVEETDYNYYLSTFRINGQKKRHSMARSLSVLQTRSFYEDPDNWDGNIWDFADKWQINDNLSYPYFTSLDAFPLSDSTLPFSGGNGTELYPCLVSTAAEFNIIRDYVGEELYYQLTSDIDLSSFDNWKGIGDNTNPFEGYINGANHIIKNLVINRPNADYQGLLGYVQYSSIDSLGLINVHITGKNNTGSFAGAFSESQISACFTFGKVTGENKTGGIIGEIISNSNMESCYFSGDVLGNANVGGLVGNSSTSFTVNNVYAQGSVDGQNDAGALIGQIGTTPQKSYTASMVQGKSNYKSLENSDIDNNWITNSSYYPQLKIFAESHNNIIQSASALSAIPVLFQAEEKADSICFSFPLHTHNALGDTISWESGILGEIRKPMATTLQPNFQLDTLIVKDEKINLSKRIYFAPYHIEPEIQVEVKSGGVEYTGDWTKQNVIFVLSGKKELISGIPVFNDSILNKQAGNIGTWQEIPAEYELDKDTSIAITFKPISKANITGEMSDTYRVKIDKTAPELSISFEPADMSKQEQAPDSVVFTVDFLDRLSGIKKVGWETIGLKNKKEGLLKNPNDKFKLEDLGSYQVKILAIDSAGNEAIRLLDVYVREKRRDSTLVRLNVNNEEIRLRQGVVDYEVSSVGYNQTSVDVEAVMTDKFAISDNQGNYPLNIGENIITIKTYAEDRQSEGIYKIKIYRKSNDISLAGLNIGGKNVPVSAGQYNYDVVVSSTIRSVEPVYLLNHPNAVCDIQSKYYLGEAKTTKEIDFKVIAEDATIFQGYKINVYRQNNVNTLQTLWIDGQGVRLENETTNYTVVVPATKENVTLSYTLSDSNSICDATTSYSLTGHETEITFYVSAEDRDLKREYNIKIRKRSSVTAINTISVNGKNYDPENLPEIALDCASDTEHFEVTAQENGTVSYLFNGKMTAGNECDITLPGPGKYDLQIIITPEDNAQPSKTYATKIVKWFGNNIFFSRWKDILAVKHEVDGFVFEKVEWYMESDEKELSGNPQAGYIHIPQEGNYYVVLDGNGPDGAFSGIRSCYTAFQFSDIEINVAPNPVAKGQQITIIATMPKEEIKGASLKLLTSAGVFIVQYPLKGHETKMVAPTTPGIYILQIITGSGIIREFKIIVQ